MNDEQHVRELHEGWIEANRTADDEWLIQHVAEDFVMWNSLGSNFFGRDAVRTLWDRLRSMATGAGPQEIVSSSWDERYHLGADLAVVHCLSRLVVDFGDEGTDAGNSGQDGQLDQVFRCTEVYQRRTGRWWMTHYHGSPHSPGVLGGV